MELTVGVILIDDKFDHNHGQTLAKGENHNVHGATFIDYSSGSSGVGWTDTLKRGLTLDLDTVIPGHGPIMKRADLKRWIREALG